jgi:bifunctional UDP-N-acetylglucosamine pyrophosphorylase/glucosamine-1-phosphate N-acetyltransferase
MDAIILTAGKGTRLHPLTKTIPKPLFPIAGRPLLSHILDSLQKYVNNVIIVVGHNEQQVKRTIEAKNYPFKISWVNQKEQRGTGHALSLCKSYIKSNHFFMMYGDIFTGLHTITTILERGQTLKGSQGVFAAKKVEHPSKYGCLLINNNLLERILEKDPNPPSNYINAGIMILPISIFEILITTSKSVRGEIELTEGINQLIQRGGQLSIHFIKEYWVDIGYPWDILTANEIAMKNLDITKKISFSSGVTIEGASKIAESVIFRPGTYIQGPVVIDENVVVGPNCYLRPGTFLGKNVHIGNGVEVKNSIVLDNTAIGHLSYIGDSIIGRGCNFGAGTKVANLKLDKTEIMMTIKGEKLPTGRKKIGVFMGDNVNTGINVSIMPGIIIGENSHIGAHTLVYQNIPSNTLLYYAPNQGLIQRPNQ